MEVETVDGNIDEVADEECCCGSQKRDRLQVDGRQQSRCLGAHPAEGG